MEHRVVITGVGVCSALGNDSATFWEALCAGRSGVRALPSPAPDVPQPIGGAAPELPPWEGDKGNRRAPDRMIQLSYHAVAEALGGTLPPLPPATQLIWGTGYTSMATIEACYEAWYLQGRVRADTVPACMPAAVLAHLTAAFGIRGMGTMVSASCASGLNAVGLGYHLVRAGIAPSVVAGSADAPLTAGMFRAWKPLRVMSGDHADAPRACRPFSADRSGLVLAEGAGALVLESLEQARRRGAPILAEIIGFSGSSTGGSIVAPDVESQSATLRDALEQARVAPGDVDYINAHATATKVGDAAEVRTIKQVLGRRAASLPVSSIKGATGHAMGASSALETIATVLALRHQALPPTINWQPGDAECDLDCVPHRARPQALNIAVKESFGFGGANAAMVLRAA
ncbi:MAG TPA: beta-ketoacyl-[acyl-carrier-protein] synthase family protein [Herpetosiphonaceae bacterium]